jgi:hypothetical protein
MATSSTNGTATGPYALELQSVLAGFPDDFNGGDVTAEVITQKTGSTVHKRIVDFQLGDINLTCGPRMSTGFFDAVKSVVGGGNLQMPDGAVVFDMTSDGATGLYFYNAWVTEIVFPALDAASNDLVSFKLTLHPERTWRAARGPISGNYVPPIASQWLSSNFRLSIDGLDCTRVSKIDEIGVKVVVQPPNGEHIMVEPYLDYPNIAVTLPETNAQSFYDWVQQRSTASTEESWEKNGTLQYLSADLRDVLFTLVFSGLGICQLTRCPSDVAGDRIHYVRAVIYCQQMAFTVGNSSVILPPATVTVGGEVLAVAASAAGTASAAGAPPIRNLQLAGARSSLRAGGTRVPPPTVTVPASESSTPVAGSSLKTIPLRSLASRVAAKPAPSPPGPPPGLRFRT